MLMNNPVEESKQAAVARDLLSAPSVLISVILDTTKLRETVGSFDQHTIRLNQFRICLRMGDHGEYRLTVEQDWKRVMAASFDLVAVSPVQVQVVTIETWARGPAVRRWPVELINVLIGKEPFIA